ncbi:MAG: Lrp/AsnC family transcriptional regulator [Candidatus Rokubacteria bacterium]|nr:Lrp/AsnC family transcriptional regulator [Candidatus Rokubacteria bacterium]
MSRSPSRNNEPQQLDLEIIARLQDDARMPFTAIAEELGLSESTVRKRVARLQKLGILHFTAFADPLRLGFQYWAQIQVMLDLATLETTAAELAKYPEIFFVGITATEYNLFLAGIFRSNADLLNFLTSRLSKMPGFRTSITSNVLKIFKRRGLFFADQPRRARRRSRILAGPSGADSDDPVRVGSQDKMIIALLQADGRKSLSRVAAELGIAEATAHRRVARLQQLGILHFEAFADPLRLGFQYCALLSLSVTPNRVSEVAARLATFPQLFFVSVTTGQCDIFVAGAFRSNEDFLRFLTRDIANIHWITGVSATNVLRLVKRQLLYPLLAEFEGRRPDSEKAARPPRASSARPRG